MPRSRSRPRRARRRQRRGGTRVRLWLIPVILLALVGGGMLAVTVAGKRYLRSDAFRQFLGKRVSQKLQVNGVFAPFSWTGGSVYSESFGGPGRSGSPIDKLDVHGIRAAVDLGSVRREAWEVEQVTVNRLEVKLGRQNLGTPPPLEDHGEEAPGKRSFWSRWIPSQVEIGGVQIADVSWEIENGPFFARGTDMVATLSPLSGTEGWSVDGRGGTLRIEDGDPAQLETFQARVRGGQVFVNEAQFKLFDHASLRTSGELAFTDTGAVNLALRSRVRELRVERVMRSDWRQKLTGEIDAAIATEGTLQTDSGRDRGASLAHKGSFRLKNGTLTALPLLDKLAEHTRAERFRRLALDLAEAPFRYHRDATKDTHVLELDLRLRSDRLFQLSGTLRIERPFETQRSRPVAGVFDVGVAREVLKWLPGAEKRVFTEERSGFLFTRMRVGGTLEAPQEDLSPRLKRAAVAESVEAVPDAAIGVGRGILGTASDLLGPSAGGLIDGLGNQVIDQADKTLDQGLRMVPILDLGR